jgi:ribosomal protein S6
MRNYEFTLSSMQMKKHNRGLEYVTSTIRNCRGRDYQAEDMGVKYLPIHQETGKRAYVLLRTECRSEHILEFERGFLLNATF